MKPFAYQPAIENPSETWMKMLRHLKDGVITYDEEGQIESVNSQVARLFAYEPNELLGQNLQLLLPAYSQSEGHENGARECLTKNNERGCQWQGRRKDDSRFLLQWISHRIPWNGHSIFLGIVISLEEPSSFGSSANGQLSNRQELSLVEELLRTQEMLQKEKRERRQAEDVIRQQQLQLEGLLDAQRHLNELKSKFITMASHQFRTPLSTIQSSADLIRRYAKPGQLAQREKHAIRINQAVVQLSGILQDFFVVNRLDDGKIALQFSEFAFTELLEEIRQESQGLLKEGQSIAGRDETAGTRLWMDRLVLKNVLLNLLSNAIKYSDKQQAIACRAWIEKPWLCIEVRDEGIGIPSGDLPRIFDRFYRGSNIENSQGTGLGLHIVQQYVEMLKGRISFESELGKGSAFKLQFKLISLYILLHTVQSKACALAVFYVGPSVKS
ncbi:MAG: PAS domain-containing sensor histidine kinase, partial [Bacteroidota bacterium]